MDHENRIIGRNATWALANMCGDGIDTCTHLINEGIVEKLVNLIGVDDRSLETLRLIAWLSLNLSRYYSTVSLTKFTMLAQPMLTLLDKQPDNRITIDICTFFENILQVSQQFEFPIAIDEVFAVISKILDRPRTSAVEYALHTISVVAKSEAFAQREQIFRSGIAAKLVNLINHRNDDISYLSVRIFHLLTLGSYSSLYIPKMIQLNILDKVGSVFVDARSTLNTKREAIALLKAIVMRSRISNQDLFQDEHASLWKSFCQLFTHRNPHVIMDCLQLLSSIELRFMTHHHLDQIYNFGIITKMAGLLDHVCDEISTRTFDMLKSFDYPELPYNPAVNGLAEE